MGWIEQWRQRRAIRKAQRGRPSVKSAGTSSLLYEMGQPAWATVDYATYAKEGYQQNPYVFACIRKIAQSVSSAPLALQSPAKDGKVNKYDVIEMHDVLRLIDRPNPFQGWQEFSEELCTYLLIAGEAFIYGAGPNARSGVDISRTPPPKELYNLRPDSVSPIRGDMPHQAIGYLYSPGGGRADIEYAPYRVCHIKLLNPLDDLSGMPPLAAAAHSVDQNNESRGWNVALLQHMARPTGALTADGALDDDQRGSLRETINEWISGSANAGRPLLLEAGLRWQSMSLTPTDMDWNEGALLSAREIATPFGVAPELIGDASNKTYNNVKEARRDLMTQTALPLLDLILSGWQRWLLPRYQPEGLRLVVQRDKIPVLQEEAAEVWERVKAADHLTINEKRAALGYPPVPDGDVVLVSIAKTPLEYTVSTPPIRLPGAGGGLSPGGNKPQQGSGGDDKEPREGEGRDGNKYAYLRLETKKAGYSDKPRESMFDATTKATYSQFVREGRTFVENGADVGLVDSFEGQWARLLTETYMAIGEESASIFFNSIGEEFTSQRKEKWQRQMTKTIGEQVSRQAALIADTTRSNVAEIDNVDGILQYYEGAGQWRAGLIAMHTVTSAYSAGALAAAKVAGKGKKRWRAIGDARTRDPHSRANGQQRDIDDPFDVGGEPMLYPGDVTLGASDWNIIGCRCWVEYN